MICALCQRDVAVLKKNTHYLTDSIIRNCLNLDGSSGREKGYYFGIFNDDASIDFNFQRNTNIEAVEAALGRTPTDQEVLNAQKIPFSVDDKFCSACEAIFTEIESAFCARIVPLFRNADLSNRESLMLPDAKLSRLFFYLQLWRTAVCHTKFNLPAVVMEDLRVRILNHQTQETGDLTHYPLSIAYLETKKDPVTGDDYVTNYVGVCHKAVNPHVIIMNDFIIQLYTDEAYEFHPVYGLNGDTFKSFINYRESQFNICIVNDATRKTILAVLYHEERVVPTMKRWKNAISILWPQIFGRPADARIIEEYIHAMTHNDGVDLAVRYSREAQMAVTQDFILRKIKEYH